MMCWIVPGAQLKGKSYPSMIAFLHSQFFYMIVIKVSNENGQWNHLLFTEQVVWVKVLKQEEIFLKDEKFSALRSLTLLTHFHPKENLTKENIHQHLQLRILHCFFFSDSEIMSISSFTVKIKVPERHKNVQWFLYANNISIEASNNCGACKSKWSQTESILSHLYNGFTASLLYRCSRATTIHHSRYIASPLCFKTCHVKYQRLKNAHLSLPMLPDIHRVTTACYI